jgi:outer membrane protein OmpA-like peptidoglycan-associated protein
MKMTVSRTTAVSISLILLAAAGGAGYVVYRRLESMNATMESLRRQADRSWEVADTAAANARAATTHAAEASENAKEAAGARAQAEQLQKQAESGQAQAEAATQKAREQASQAHEEMARMRRERDEELNHMQEVLSHIVETRRTKNGMVMSLSDNTFKFDFDSSELKPQNRELLSRIAGILLASKGYGLTVFGYTDDIGTADYNQKLSVRRAQSVRDYLVEAGLEPGMVSVRGYGKTSPMVQGSSEAARAKNRRVEIALTDTIIKYEIPR